MHDYDADSDGGGWSVDRQEGTSHDRRTRGARRGRARHGSRRSPRVGDSGSPVGSTLSIVLAVIAVIAGFFILRAITDDDGDSGSATDDTTSSVLGSDLPADTGGAVTTVAAGPTTIAPSKTGATVSVANASGVSGSAASMTQALAAAGYTMGEAGNNTGGSDLTTTVVYFAPGDAAAQAVAQSVALDLGGLTTEAMPNPPPIDKGLGTSTVLLMVGTDTAGKTIAESARGAATATTGAGGVQPPAAVGVTTTVGGGLITDASMAACSMHRRGSRIARSSP